MSVPPPVPLGFFQMTSPLKHRAHSWMEIPYLGCLSNAARSHEDDEDEEEDIPSHSAVYGGIRSSGTRPCPLLWTPCDPEITTPTVFLLQLKLYWSQMRNTGTVSQKTQEHWNISGVKWTHYDMLSKREEQKHPKDPRSRGGKLIAHGINENLRLFEAELSHKHDVCH